MVKLAKHGQGSDDVGIGELEIITSPKIKNPEIWANAAEFVPGQLWRGSGRFFFNSSIKGLFKY